jgi:hypothetical protein
MTREFAVDLSIRGTYDNDTYELGAVEEALAQWSLMYPNEYDNLVMVTEDDPILVEEVHVDDINSWRIA